MLNEIPRSSLSSLLSTYHEPLVGRGSIVAVKGEGFGRNAKILLFVCEKSVIIQII